MKSIVITVFPLAFLSLFFAATLFAHHSYMGEYDLTASISLRGVVTKVEWGNYRLRLSADIETINKFQRSYEIVREPLHSVAPDVFKRAAPLCRYMVVDAKGKVLLAGDARPADDATFQVDLKGKLPAGRYEVFAEVMVNENAMNAAIQRIPIVIPSSS